MPKAKVERVENNMAPKFLRSALVHVSQLSVAEDSGWRAVEESRVLEIYADLRLVSS